MSHPIPGHDYSENRRKLNSTQKHVKKLFGGLKGKNEHPFHYLKRVAKGKALEKKKGKSFFPDDYEDFTGATTNDR